MLFGRAFSHVWDGNMNTGGLLLKGIVPQEGVATVMYHDLCTVCCRQGL